MPADEDKDRSPVPILDAPTGDAGARSAWRRRWRWCGQVLLCLATLLGMVGFQWSPTMLGAAVILGVIGLFASQEPFHRLPGFWCAVAYGILMVVLQRFSPYGLQRMPNGACYAWVMVYVVALGASRPGMQRWTAWAVLIGAVVAAGLGILQYVVGLGSGSLWRLDSQGSRFLHAQGFFSNKLRYGFTLAVAAILLSMPARSLQVPWWVVWPVRLLTIGANFLSFARGQVIALWSGSWTRYVVGGWKQALIASVIIGVSFAGVIVLFWWLRPLSLQALLQGEDGRREIWRAAWTIFKDHPWFGIGHDGLREAFNVYQARGSLPASQWGQQFPNHAHNSFVGLALEYGIFVLGLYLAWMVLLLRGIIRRCGWRGHPTQVAIGLTVAFVAGGMTEDLAGLSVSRYAFFVAIGWMLACALNPERSAITATTAAQAGT